MFIAERQGFEPRVPRSTTVFKTAAIDHSATSPKLLLHLFLTNLICCSFKFKSEALFVKSGAKIQRDSKTPNVFIKKMI